MIHTEVVARARRCVGYKCFYRLGTGGMDPNSLWPWDKEVACDCSGFSDWVQGFAREHLGVWFSTDMIVGDARSSDGILFYEVPWVESRPADLVVYPGKGIGDDRKHGHVGVISEVDSEGPHRVIHCSHGNWNRTGDAIQETDAGLWKLHPSIIARCKLVEA